MVKENSRGVANPHEFLISVRGVYLMGRAIDLLLESMNAVEGAHKEVSDIGDLNYLRDEVFGLMPRGFHVDTDIKAFDVDTGRVETGYMDASGQPWYSKEEFDAYYAKETQYRQEFNDEMESRLEEPEPTDCEGGNHVVVDCENDATCICGDISTAPCPDPDCPCNTEGGLNE